MKISVSDDLKRLRTELTATAAHIERANRSALAWVGNVLRLALSRYVRAGGEGWPRRHFLSRRLSRNPSGAEVIRSRGGTDRPYLWLAKWTRYRVETAAGGDVYGFSGPAVRTAARVRAGFGQSHGIRGAAGGDNSWNLARAASTAGGSRTFATSAMLASMVETAEHGGRIRVTEQMRRHIAGLMARAAGKTKRRRAGAVWAFRRDTHTLTVPRRPIIDPVYRKSASHIGAWYRERFYASLQRYQGGTAKDWRTNPGDFARHLLGETE